MAASTLFSSADTSALTLTADTYVSLIGGPQTVNGSGGMVSIQGYAYNLDFSQVILRVVVDGSEVVTASEPVMAVNVVLGLGTHTIDFQALSFNSDRVATTRGVTAFTL